MVPESGRRRHPASLPADKRRNIRFSETEVPLREDVHELGGQIGAMVRDRVGEELFNSVEAVRSLAIARRDGDARAHQRLVDPPEPCFHRASHGAHAHRCPAAASRGCRASSGTSSPQPPPPAGGRAAALHARKAHGHMALRGTP